MKKILRLPVNVNWYNLLISGEIDWDYREITPYWIDRLENKQYDVVEFYHRFKKEIKPIQFKFNWIRKGKITSYDKDVFIIKFGERII